MALFLQLAVGDALQIGDDTVIRLESKSGQRARLRIDAAADVRHLKSGEEPSPLTRRAPPSAPPAATPEPPAVPPFTRNRPPPP